MLRSALSMFKNLELPWWQHACLTSLDQVVIFAVSEPQTFTSKSGREAVLVVETNQTCACAPMVVWRDQNDSWSWVVLMSGSSD
eukprot:119049-Amphidinium_carterae.1